MADKGMVRRSSLWRVGQVVLLIIAVAAAVLLAVLDDRAAAQQPGSRTPRSDVASLDQGGHRGP